MAFWCPADYFEIAPVYGQASGCLGVSVKDSVLWGLDHERSNKPSVTQFF